MKAILVVDMPKDCWECPMHIDGLDDENEEIMVCNAKARESHYGDKPSWCPLKPMPQKLDANDWHRMFGGTYKEREAKGYGWNACIEELLGETE